ncbi:MAG: electron transfer flavoprotein subunit alpha/FixB family protein [Candidatus Omnitrophica bacterium]|nr:electron transfer flavoprotein subunit alpha/FixB family protein [Candidatus Omnitrophota bacterium]
MAGIWIYADHREQTLELLNIGRHLAVKMGAPLTALVAGDRNAASDYIAHGADNVLLLPELTADQSADAHLPVIVTEAVKADPDVFLLAATVRGKELAARIATRLETGLCSSCMAFDYDENGKVLKMQRLAYGGAALQQVTCLKRPAMATVPPRTFEPAAAEVGRKGQIRELPAPPPAAVKVLERKVRTRETRDITEAKVVVCAGRGFEKPEDLALARQLADALGGEIGCTRPISEENHWLPEELCIGLSGIQVKPDLYLGLGVSGQIQHVTGIRNAKVIAAVNRDENAPIFGVADFGIVGNLYDAVPKLIQELKKGS